MVGAQNEKIYSVHSKKFLDELTKMILANERIRY